MICTIAAIGIILQFSYYNEGVVVSDMNSITVINGGSGGAYVIVDDHSHWVELSPDKVMNVLKECK